MTGQVPNSSHSFNVVAEIAGAFKAIFELFQTFLFSLEM
jgi:hypothetical protein